MYYLHSESSPNIYRIHMQYRLLLSQLKASFMYVYDTHFNAMRKWANRRYMGNKKRHEAPKKS